MSLPPRDYLRAGKIFAEAIEGSPKMILKIYPSTFSQIVEGLDGIFRMPYGCFEQTSSTTYPNVLALDYLKRTGRYEKVYNVRVAPHHTYFVGARLGLLRLDAQCFM